MKTRSLANWVRGNRFQTRICEFFAVHKPRGGRSITLEVERHEARFTLSGPEPPIIALTMQVVSTSGTPIAEVSPGQNFKVQVIVQDLRDAELAKGVFSAFTDILFDPTIVEPISANSIAHGSNYRTAPTGDTLTVGVVDELGGIVIDPFSNWDAQLYLLAEVTFLAKTAGNPLLRLDAPDRTISDILLLADSSNAELPTTKVSFGTSHFIVGESFQQADIPALVVNNTLKRDHEQTNEALGGNQFEFYAKTVSPFPNKPSNTIKPSNTMGRSYSHDAFIQSYSQGEVLGSIVSHSASLSGQSFLQEDSAEVQNRSANLQVVDWIAAINAGIFKDPLFSNNEPRWSNSNHSHFIVNSNSVAIEDSSLVDPDILVPASSQTCIPATKNGHSKTHEFESSAGKKLTERTSPRTINKYFADLNSDHFRLLEVRHVPLQLQH